LSSIKYGFFHSVKFLSRKAFPSYKGNSSVTKFSPQQSFGDGLRYKIGENDPSH
jgi:hypothetical protein